MANTFYGGISMRDCMQYIIPKKLNTEKMPSPLYLTIPISAKGMNTALPTVSTGDSVAIGELIASSASLNSSAENDGAKDLRLYSPVSGTIAGIGSFSLADGSSSDCIVIKNDFDDRLSASVRPMEKKIEDISKREILRIIKNAGIPLDSSAAFPPYDELFPISEKADDKKLKGKKASPQEKDEHRAHDADSQGAECKIKKLIIDCTEGEPYVYSNHAAVVAEPAFVAGGAKILMMLLGLRNATFAVTSEIRDYYDIYAELKALPESKSPLIAKFKPCEKNLFDVVKLKSKYPMDTDSLIVYAVTGTELPENVLPGDRGFMIVKAGICRAIYLAFTTGMPYIERIVTVNGDCIKNPCNLIAPFGASVESIVEACGNLKAKPEKLICSGIMSGYTVNDPEIPLTRDMSSILAFSKNITGKTLMPIGIKYNAPPSCINCGKCIEVCPMHLMPLYYAEYSHDGKYELCNKYNISCCTECGCCEYICPGKLPLLKYIRSAKCFSNVNGSSAAKHSGTKDTLNSKGIKETPVGASKAVDAKAPQSAQASVSIKKPVIQSGGTANGKRK